MKPPLRSQSPRLQVPLDGQQCGSAPRRALLWAGFLFKRCEMQSSVGNVESVPFVFTLY